MKKLLHIAILFASIFMFTITAFANSLEKLEIPSDATVLITVEGSADSNTGTLAVYRKGMPAGPGASAQVKDGWTEILNTKAMLGKKGLYKTKEGDCKTPVGTFKMNTPFGIKPALSGFPSNYLQVDSTHYWVGDSASKQYNKMVSTRTYTDFSKSASEHISAYSGYYNYCIDSGYNFDGTANKGSAIFLHCVVDGQDTHGCIAIPEKDMSEVMRAYRDGSTYMIIYDKAVK